MSFAHCLSFHIKLHQAFAEAFAYLSFFQVCVYSATSAVVTLLLLWLVTDLLNTLAVCVNLSTFFQVVSLSKI